MGDLASALARALGPGGAQPGLRAAEAGAAAPVLQLNAFPLPLDLAALRDAFAPDNPTGSHLATRRFRDLCNAIPAFQRSFEPSGLQVEEVWRNLVFGASGGSPLTRRLLAEAQKLIGEYELADMGGTADAWLPVGASPPGWADLLDQAEEVTLELDEDGDSAGGYRLIGSGGGLEWTTASGQRLPVQGRVRRIRLRAIKVDLSRPWLDFQLLALGQWSVEGHPAGFYSSGEFARNDGLFPLLPVAMIVGRDIRFEGEFSDRDRGLMQGPAALGPFPAAAAGAGSHVIGYVTRLVPLAPQVSGRPAGVVLVRNEGGFVARFALSWQQDGKEHRARSGSFPVLAAKSLPIPAEAQEVALHVEVMTFPPPFETWRTVAELRLGGPRRKAYLLSGTTGSPKFREIPGDRAPV
ncbi:hypothetical protein [Paracoccus sp. (in: a-proteobacteria)]|uniref:hypothetical protein n=1 Tax=Paracoccus sp. TaxID=267 RepID=UPI0032204D8C